MKVVVTGGAGFIGANLCRRLCSAPGVSTVTVIDDLSTGAEANLVGLDVEFIHGDVRDNVLVARSVRGAASVVHLAAMASVQGSIADPRRTHDVNVTGTMNLLEGARAAGVAQVVFASSSGVYGDVAQDLAHEGLAPSPLSPYAASKVAAEAYVVAYGRSMGLSTLAFRFFNVFGPLQPASHAYAAVIPAFIFAALTDAEMTIYGDGRQTRDFIDVAVVTYVIAQSVLRELSSPGPVNLATGRETSLLSLVSALEATLGHSLEPVHRPARTGDVMRSRADVTLMRDLLGDVEIPDLAESLARTVEWFRRSSRASGLVPRKSL